MKTAAISLSLLTLAAAGCIKTTSEVEVKPVEVSVAPIEIKPIQISLEVRVKVEDELKQQTRAAERAPEADAVFRRLREREPQIAKCLADGLAGESNQGFLVNRLESDTPGASVVQFLIDMDNADRLELMQRIAERQKLTPEQVRAGWAVRTAERRPAGTWLEDADGRWYQK